MRPRFVWFSHGSSGTLWYVLDTEHHDRDAAQAVEVASCRDRATAEMLCMTLNSQEVPSE